MKVLIHLTILIALSWSVTSHAELYMAAGNDTDTNLYTVDENSGTILSTVGDTGVLLTGLAFNPLSGELYGTTSNNSSVSPDMLVRIDPETASTTVIGAAPAGTIVDISFAPDGTLYGWSETTDKLVTVDLTTGVPTVISTGSTPSSGAGLDFSPDGRLWRFGNETGSGSFCQVTAWDPKTGDYVIDTAAMANCDYIPGGSHDSDGNLFVIFSDQGNPTKSLGILDKDTGDIAVIGLTLDRASAIAWRPTFLDYTGIEPCRAFDTRKQVDGDIAAGETRDFYIWGGGLSDQGGSDECYVPQKAVSIEINFTAVGPAAFGYLRAWAAGNPEPVATLMTWPANVSISNSTSVPINNDLDTDLSVKVYNGSTQLVGDIVGYRTRAPR